MSPSASSGSSLARLLVGVCALAGVAPLLGAQQVGPLSPPPSGTFVGQVFDSTASRALAGAELGLIPVDDPANLRTVVADSAGRFRFDSLAPGRYLAGACHHFLDRAARVMLALQAQWAGRVTLPS
jgi:hypothetical protein